MESVQNIKNRIQTIGSTKQITKSMRLASTAKMQRNRNRLEDNRPFFRDMENFIRTLAGSLKQNGSRNPYLEGRKDKPSAVIVLSSDRGLCGSYNLNIGKKAASFIKEMNEVKLVTVGTKVSEYFYRKGINIEHRFAGISETPFFDDARDLSTLVLDWFKKQEIGAVYLVYTQFVNILTQKPVVMRLIPLEESLNQSGQQKSLACEPEGESLLNQIMPFYMSSLIYGAMLEAYASELSARIISMDAADKNSDEILASLTLLYNQARQAAITQEIIEIASGADALS